MKRSKYIILVLLVLTILALVPSYIVRCNPSIYMWLYNKLGTYPGDLLNFFANYLGRGLHYPPEYPAGLRWFYEAMGFYRYGNFASFFTVNALILAGFATGITLLIYKIILLRNKKNILELKDYKSIAGKIIIFWILAPTFLFYSLYNYDLPVVFLVVLATYLYYKKMPYWAIASLALGTVLKVFPIFLMPIFILKSPKKDWWKLAILFIIVVAGLNLPYMLSDFKSWIYPYTWQIGTNISRDPTAGTYWWIFYPIFKNKIGWASLVLFAGFYIYSYLKLQKTSLVNLSIAIILIFLATDRIYSPQYNLYLLPFLAMADYKINKKPFYLLEIPNVIHVGLFFWLRENLLLFQALIFLKYFSIGWLYIDNFKNSKSKVQISNKI